MDRRKFLKTAALGAAAVCCDPATATQGSRKSTSSWVRISNVGLGGGKMMCFANRGPSQMLSTVFVSKTGHVAVVDGGHFDDGEFLYGKLKELGGRVDLWFITHPHSDHYGALDTILRKFGGRGIDIGLLVYNFADLEWIAHNEPKSSELMQKFLSLVNRNSGRIRVRKPAKGNVLALDGGVTFEILNDPYLIGERDSVNNLSVASLVTMGGKRILVTGDLAVDSGNRLMAENGTKLKCDICFMSHHGQHGVTKDFYKMASPEVVVWPTPDWLWENDIGEGPGSGSFITNYTKCWMQELGVKKQYLLTCDCTIT